MNQEVNNDIHSLSHTKWNCKYHIVFAQNNQSENLKTKYRNREFWCRGYYVDTANECKNIEAYIRNQLEEDRLSDQMSFSDYDLM